MKFLFLAFFFINHTMSLNISIHNKSGRVYQDIVTAPLASRTFSYTVGEHEINWVHNYPPQPGVDEAVKNAARSHGDCNTCTRRARQFIRIAGPEGAMLFHGENDINDPVMKILQGHANTVCNQTVKPELILVTPDTFGVSQYTDPRGSNQGLFHHWTIVPNGVTEGETLTRISGLWNLLLHSIDERLTKFLIPAARDDMEIIHGVLDELKRPDHYKNAVNWVIGIQDKFPKSFDQMNDDEIMQLRIFAMMTGHASGTVHFDFSTSSNFMSFMELESREAVKQEMDKRSDPARHMQRALGAALLKHGVTSKQTVSMTWDTSDDLDLQLQTDTGKKCYYGAKCIDGYVLDFDAGINGKEKNPCENISCRAGVVRIQANNYSIRTHGDVHFLIIIRDEGKPDLEIPCVWPKGRCSGQFMDILTYEFKAHEAMAPVLSAKAATAALAQDNDFKARFGVPHSTVATMADLVESGLPLVVWEQPVTKFNSDDSRDPEAVAGAFELMMQAAKPVNAAKGRLHEAVARHPETMDDLVKVMGAGSHDLAVHLQDHQPGYIVDLQVKTDDALKSGKTSMLASCHYQDKFKHPVKPVSPGTARMDDTWAMTRGDGKVSVCGITKMDGKTFFVLQGARLPDAQAFPLGGGFYPQDLSVNGHIHRGRWTYFHTQLKPLLPVAGAAGAGASPLAIGTFLTGASATVYLDGKELRLKV